MNNKKTILDIKGINRDIKKITKFKPKQRVASLTKCELITEYHLVLNELERLKQEIKELNLIRKLEKKED